MLLCWHGLGVQNVQHPHQRTDTVCEISSLSHHPVPWKGSCHEEQAKKRAFGSQTDFPSSSSSQEILGNPARVSFVRASWHLISCPTSPSAVFIFFWKSPMKNASDFMVPHFFPSFASLYLDLYCNPLAGLMTCSGDDVKDSQGSLHLKAIRKNKNVASHLSQRRWAVRDPCPRFPAETLVTLKL